MKRLAITKYVFGGVGVVMLVAAAFWAVHTRSFIARASLAEGTVIDLVSVSSSSGSPTWKPVVRFVAADGRERQFASSFSSNPPSYQRGERVQVLYSASNPQDAAINGFLALWTGPLIIGGIGLVCFSIGAGLIVVPWVFARRTVRLRANGTPVQAKVQGVERNIAVKMNGVNPWRVAAQWQDPATGEIHVFRSDNLWFDPSEYLKREAVTVYVDPANPRRYWMDVSFLPKLAS